MPAHHAHRASAEQVKACAEQVEKAECLTDLSPSVFDGASPRDGIKVQAYQVVLIASVLREGTPDYPAGLRFDHRCFGLDQGAVAPARVDGLVAAKAPALGEADQASQEVMPVSEHEIAPGHINCVLTLPKALNSYHVDAITRWAS